jgi:hypothetical protein
MNHMQCEHYEVRLYSVCRKVKVQCWQQGDGAPLIAGHEIVFFYW